MVGEEKVGESSFQNFYNNAKQATLKRGQLFWTFPFSYVPPGLAYNAGALTSELSFSQSDNVAQESSSHPETTPVAPVAETAPVVSDGAGEGGDVSLTSSESTEDYVELETFTDPKSKRSWKKGSLPV
jgi:hypothetical protein